MSLRAYYAGEALKGYLSHERNLIAIAGDPGSRMNLALDCVEMADTMIEALKR